MLNNLGYGRRAYGRLVNEAVNSKSFVFTTALPPEFTYTRAGVQCVRNTSGAWVSVAANVPPFDHSTAGAAMGLLFEPARTNKTAQRNFAPTDTTGVMVISGTASIACVASAIVAGATIQGSLFTALQNGNVIEIQGGASGGVVQISEQMGNTNAHSWRVCAAATTSGFCGNFSYSDGIGVVNFNPVAANVFYELTQENQAPNNAVRYLRMSIQAGKTAYIIGTQLEEGAFVTSPIVTSCAGATRNMGVCVASGLGGGAVPWFDTAQGAIVAECMFAKLGFDSQFVFLANEGAGLTNSIGVFSSIGAPQFYGRDIINGTNHQNDQVHCPIVMQRAPVAMTWKSGESTAVCGPMRYETRQRAGSPVGMDRIYIGGRPFGNAMYGWVKSLTVMNKPRSLLQLGALMFPASGTYKVVACGGQSNKYGYFRSQVGSYNGGEISGVQQMNTYWPTSENWMMNGARSGSFLIKQNDPNADNSNANWWYDPLETGDLRWGPCMKNWMAMASAIGASRIEAIDWDQGESDSLTSVSDFKAASLAVFNGMRDVVGAKPVFITGIGRRSDSQNTGYNNVRRAQRELAAENAWIHRAPEKFTQVLADAVHLTDAGYGVHGTQLMRKILSTLGASVSGVVNGPTITAASRSGVIITVTLSAGDFTPASAIEGFKFFANGTEIAITAAVRTNATTITLTLASAPASSPEVLYYGYGTMIEVNTSYANLAKDNSPYTLGLMTDAITL
jgi:hypothetical protein